MSIIAQNYSCDGCGGMQKYSPKSHALVCIFCGTEVAIAQSAEVKENDYRQTLSEMPTEKESKAEEVKCVKCASSFSFEAHTFASNCPYCDTPAIIDCSQALKPDGLLPFIVTRDEAKEKFKKWVSSRWFAPTVFTKYFSNSKILVGHYLPHWTYDTDTITQYQGERGDAYYVSVTQTVIEEGKSVQKEVQERRIDWTYVEGVVYTNFDDVIIPASPRVSASILNALEPWESNSAKGFDSKYIAGFEAQEYTTTLEKGFDLAKDEMASVITSKIYEDIGGDEQRISSKQTEYNNITYKNVLLPIWTAFFTWKNKGYQYAINAQTGELVGERPYSITKITFAVLAVSTVIAGIVYFDEIKLFLGL